MALLLKPPSHTSNTGSAKIIPYRYERGIKVVRYCEVLHRSMPMSDIGNIVQFGAGTTALIAHSKEGKIGLL